MGPRNPFNKEARLEIGVREAARDVFKALADLVEDRSLRRNDPEGGRLLDRLGVLIGKPLGWGIGSNGEAGDLGVSSVNGTVHGSCILSGLVVA